MSTTGKVNPEHVVTPPVSARGARGVMAPRRAPQTLSAASATASDPTSAPEGMAVSSKDSSAPGDGAASVAGARNPGTNNLSISASPPSKPLAKPQRQHRIARLLESHAVSSQGQLVELLSIDGVVATQATVSRDLEDMGAVKVRVPGGDLVYAIPELPVDQIAPHDHLRRVLGEWVVDVARSLNLVVLRTPPGSAHVVASALDRAGLDEVLGTVAGDDTILVVCSERAGGEAVAEHLRNLAGL